MAISRAPRAGAVSADVALSMGLSAALSVALVGCGPDGGRAAAPDPPGTPAGDRADAIPSHDTAAAPVSHDGACRAADLRLSLDGGDAAAGTSYRSLVFTNVSSQPCVVQGFPGVSYVGGGDGGDGGHQVGAPAVRDGGKGAPITLGRGETASAAVGFVDVRNYDAADCHPQPVRGVRVYPPEETVAKFVRLPGTGCANDKIQQLTVRALRAGDGG